tara:strand:- start:8300 stop:8560 length:261 start_codon:yes stop_codon:yes gene_type:complete
MAYRVLKPISSSDGSTIATGEIVEADGWRNVKALVNGRFIIELANAVPVAPEKKSEPAQTMDKTVVEVVDSLKFKAKKSKTQEEGI